MPSQAVVFPKGIYIKAGPLESRMYSDSRWVSLQSHGIVWGHMNTF